MTDVLRHSGYSYTSDEIPGMIAGWEHELRTNRFGLAHMAERPITELREQLDALEVR